MDGYLENEPADHIPQKLKHQSSAIPQYPLSPKAKAGVLIKRFDQDHADTEHDNQKPHRDDHYLLMIATAGHFTLDLDFNPVEIEAPAVLMIFPGQVHHMKQMKDPEGWAVSFDPSLMFQEFPAITEKDSYGLIKPDQNPGLFLHLETLLEEMEYIQAQLPAPFMPRALRSLLDVLLCVIFGAYATSGPANLERPGRALLIEEAFFKLLKQHYRDWKKPAQYASALNISVAHLYDTVKVRTGTSVSGHIQQFCMLEAKRQLCYSDLSVREIGYQLGYDEPVYFGKLFKKVTGQTPLQFRAKFRD
jgi:AraC family transcriptional activator of pobA